MKEGAMTDPTPPRPAWSELEQQQIQDMREFSDMTELPERVITLQRELSRRQQEIDQTVAVLDEVAPLDEGETKTLAARVRDEMADYYVVIDHCSKAYAYLTGGRISNPMTLWDVVQREQQHEIETLTSRLQEHDLDLQSAQSDRDLCEQEIVRCEQEIATLREWIVLARTVRNELQQEIARLQQAQMWEPEKLAQQFHEAYERLAPSFGYETREASRKLWADVPERNRALMSAVCAEVFGLPAPPKEDA